MKRDDIIRTIQAHESDIRAEGVAHLALFGSRARGDERADSDLDILLDVQPESRFSLLNLSGVGLIIEDALGFPTQIVLRRSASPAFLARIADDLTPVF